MLNTAGSIYPGAAVNLVFVGSTSKLKAALIALRLSNPVFVVPTLLAFQGVGLIWGVTANASPGVSVEWDLAWIAGAGPE
jgi:hypothetical protein